MIAQQPTVCGHGTRWPHPCEACFDGYLHLPVPPEKLSELIGKWEAVNIGIPLHANDLETIRTTVAALRRLRAIDLAGGPQKLGWRPIDTAPRDGRDVLVGYDSASVWIVRSAWYRGPEVIEQQAEQFDVSDIGWWSYVNGVTQERLWGFREPTHWLCEIDRQN